MDRLNLVMPMAGEGSRFKKKGFTVPKPLIELEGVPLFKRAIDSLKGLFVPMEFFFIVRQEHIDLFHIDDVIRCYYPAAHIYPVAHTTRGAVETCMLASTDFLKEESLLVLDCDLEFYCRAFEQFILSESVLPVGERAGGGLVSFSSEDARYSYARVNDAGAVVQTAEKEVISRHALAGAYYFSSAELFMEVARELLAIENIGKPEYYLSLLYNRILSRGYTVKLFQLDAYLSNGTPEELNREL